MPSTGFPTKSGTTTGIWVKFLMSLPPGTYHIHEITRRAQKAMDASEWIEVRAKPSSRWTAMNILVLQGVLMKSAVTREWIKLAPKSEASGPSRTPPDLRVVQLRTELKSKLRQVYDYLGRP